VIAGPPCACATLIIDGERQNASFERRLWARVRMSAVGTKQTSIQHRRMSGHRGGADVTRASQRAERERERERVASRSCAPDQ
jgi:hypothetical protein